MFGSLSFVRILDRYILGIFFKNLLIALVSMVAIFLSQAILGALLDPAYTVAQLIHYHLLNTPQITVQSAGPSVLLATVMTLSNLSRSSELVACYSLGVSLRRVMSLVLSVVVVFSMLIWAMSDRVLPPVFKIRTAYYMKEVQKRQDFFLDIQMDKVWYRSKNLIYNLQRFDHGLKTIFGMTVYTFDGDFNLVEVVEAERAEFDGQNWSLLNGSVTVFAADSPFPLIQGFQKKQMQIAETPQDFKEIDKEVEGLRTGELEHYIARMKAAGADTKAYEVKLHSRLSLSLIPIVMCFLAVPFSLSNRREGGVARDLALCLVVTFFYWLFYSVSLSLGTSGALPPRLAAWLPSSIFVALAATLIARRRS